MRAARARGSRRSGWRSSTSSASSGAFKMRLVERQVALGWWLWAGGFQADDAVWEAVRTKLVDFKAMPGHGHCRVHYDWPDDPKLGGWVNNQRQYKKRLDAGRPSPRITEEANRMIKK